MTLCDSPMTPSATTEREIAGLALQALLLRNGAELRLQSTGVEEEKKPLRLVK